MKLCLIFIGKTTDSYLKEGIEIYLKRLTNYIQVTTTVLPASSLKDKWKALDEEGSSIESKLVPGDFLILLDENGNEVTSRKLADQIMKWIVQGIGRIVFVVGGAYGISPALKKRSNYILSFSKLTFTHQMIRLMLVEQLYRAMTITRNEGYHHD